VEEATGVARSTINRGMRELEIGVSDVHRQRRKGGGRKKNRASPRVRRRSERSRRTAYERIADAASALVVTELGASGDGLEREGIRRFDLCRSLDIETPWR
jgi:hypothetical protein